MPFVTLLRGTIFNNWREILIVILLTIVIYQNTSNIRYLFFMETIPSLQLRLEQANSNLDTCVTGNQTLATVIDERNDEVQKWKDISSELEAKTKALSSKLDKLRMNTNKKVDAVLKSKTPKNCNSSIQYLRDSRNELIWQK